jgi:radical SAM superfamily enzyme YgiQ (UPF0313 family)
MRALVIRPPIFYKDFSYGVVPAGLYSALLVRYQPVGLMYVAALLRQAGHRVILVDAEAEELEIQSVIRRVRPFAPDLIIGNVNLYNSPQNFEDLGVLKQALGATLVVRGHFPGEYPDLAAQRSFVDYTLRGKGWSAIAPLAAALAAGRDPGNIAGVLYRRNGAVIDGGPEAPIDDVDTLPFPARDLVDDRLYATNLTVRRPCTVAFASFGCPFDCAYCTDHTTPYRLRGVPSVLAEIEDCARRGIREIAFLDPTFTVRRNWTDALCRGLIARRLDLTFTIRTRGDLLDRDLIQLLAEAGCVRVSVGIESADPQILENVGRRVDLERVCQASAWIAEAGMMGFGYFMVGNEGESDESLSRTLKLVRRLPLHFAQFLQAVPLPHTDILASCREKLGADLWVEVSRGRFPTAEEFRSQRTSLSLAAIHAWQRRLFRAFYFDPRRLWRILRLRHWPLYVWRQFDLLRVVLPLVAMRRLRRRWPGAGLAVYPRARNGGPGDAAP